MPCRIRRDGIKILSEKAVCDRKLCRQRVPLSSDTAFVFTKITPGDFSKTAAMKQGVSDF